MIPLSRRTLSADKSNGTVEVAGDGQEGRVSYAYSMLSCVAHFYLYFTIGSLAKLEVRPLPRRTMMESDGGCSLTTSV